MLKKENRLQKDRDFQKVFKGSRPVHTQNLAFRVTKRSNKIQDTRYKQIQNSKNSNEILKQVPDDRSEKLKAESQKLEASRFGFIISNKISKLATRRNALKRQLRSIIQDKLSDIKPGYNIIVTVKADFPYPYEQKAIREQVEEGLTEAGLWND